MKHAPCIQGAMSHGSRGQVVFRIHSGIRARGLAHWVTNDLERRLAEHRARLSPGFTARYQVNRLLYFEQTDDIHAALERERQLKGWRRRRKVALIRTMNPSFLDLAPPSDDIGPESGVEGTSL